jgi:hypothetical protein
MTVEYICSLSRNYFEVSDQLHAPAILNFGKCCWHSLGRTLSGPQNRPGIFGKENILDPFGTRSPIPSVVWPVASRCKDCTVSASKLLYNTNKISFCRFGSFPLLYYHHNHHHWWLYRPLLGFGRHFESLGSVHSRWGSSGETSANPKASSSIQGEHRMSTHKHLWLEWNANVGIQCLSGRRQSMHRPSDHCDRRLIM